MIDNVNLRALSYTVIQDLESENVEKLENTDGPNTKNVVRNVIETETPLWAFHYIQECSEELTEPANQIPSIIPKQKFVEKAREYAERDGQVIDLTNPASQDWMSEDPMSRSREEYQERVESINSAVYSVLCEVTELSENEIEELSGAISNEIDLLQWEVNRVKKADGKLPEKRVAELYLATGPNAVIELLNEYTDYQTVKDSIDRKALESYRLTENERDERICRLKNEVDETG